MGSFQLFLQLQIDETSQALQNSKAVLAFQRGKLQTYSKQVLQQIVAAKCKGE
jgi:hypothetical protein